VVLCIFKNDLAAGILISYAYGSLLQALFPDGVMELKSSGDSNSFMSTIFASSSFFKVGVHTYFLFHNLKSHHHHHHHHHHHQQLFLHLLQANHRLLHSRFLLSRRVPLRQIKKLGAVSKSTLLKIFNNRRKRID